MVSKSSQPQYATIRSKGIYNGLTVFPDTVTGLSAIVTGSNGISGDHMVRVLAESPQRWSNIYTMSRRPLQRTENGRPMLGIFRWISEQPPGGYSESYEGTWCQGVRRQRFLLRSVGEMLTGTHNSPGIMSFLFGHPSSA